MRALRIGVRGLGEVCITLGLVLVLFVVWQLWWTDVAAGRTQHQLTEQLQQTWRAEPLPPHTSSPAVPDDPALKLRTGKAFALLHVPRFGSDYVRPILQGVELDVLDRGVGHYPGSADPGAVGNFAVAGHRVTYAKPFNEIAKLRRGDAVVVETATTWFVYRVVGMTIVAPSRVDVIAAVPGRPAATATQRMMTMTACHPEYSARQRYVVFSELEQRLAKSPGVVPDVLKK